MSMVTHGSILAWEIPRTEEPGGLQSMVAELDTTERLSTAQETQTRTAQSLDLADKEPSTPKEVHTVKTQRACSPPALHGEQKQQDLMEDRQEGMVSMHFYLKVFIGGATVIYVLTPMTSI